MSNNNDIKENNKKYNNEFDINNLFYFNKQKYIGYNIASDFLLTTIINNENTNQKFICNINNTMEKKEVYVMGHIIQYL